MEFLFFLLSFLICSSNLLDNVRKDVIDIALLYLPKRENVNYLKMVNEMLEAKTKYSMNKEESVYFAYKWISQNIEFNCKYIIEEESSTEINLTYKEGVGGVNGFTCLFNSLCQLLNVDSNIITGLTKIRTYDKTHLIDIKDYAWNSVFIGEQYYLIDSIRGGGSCLGTKFSKNQNDIYFGMDPKDYIRLNFPNEEKWQLLSESITKDKFSSMAITSKGFFNFFTAISPDIQTLKNGEDIKLVMTFDKPIDKIEISAIMFDLDTEDNHLPWLYELDKPIIQNGTCLIYIWAVDTGYLEVSIKINDKEFFYITYEAYYFPKIS